MKVSHCAKPLPRSFTDHPAGCKIVAECDIGVRGHDSSSTGRLRAKLLVFRTRRDMNEFSKQALGSNNAGACGIVHELAEEVLTITPGRAATTCLRVDPRYFCVICLVQGYLTMEIVTHEACHAGIYFSQRSKRRWPNQKDAPSEAICYPTGRIAAAINRFLHDKGLYQ